MSTLYLSQMSSVCPSLYTRVVLAQISLMRQAPRCIDERSTCGGCTLSLTVGVGIIYIIDNVQGEDLKIVVDNIKKFVGIYTVEGNKPCIL